MRAKRKALLPAERTAGEKKACERLLQLPQIKRAESVFIYCSTAEEMGTEFIISRLMREGKNVFVPRVNGSELEMVRLQFDTKFTSGSFGIREPQGMAEEAEGFVCITPCLAVDEKGHRTGYGGGFYDRFFEKHECYKIAICWDFQVLKDIPHETHDVQVDMIITEKRTIVCGK